jgi:hypothetical protein
MPKPRTIFAFCLTLVLCDIFIILQHSFVPEKLRPVAVTLYVITAFTGYFLFVRPEPLFPHARNVSTICALAALLIIIVQDIAIRKTGFSWNFLIVIVIAGIAPVLGAFLYRLLLKIRSE